MGDYGITDDQRYAYAHRCTSFGTFLTGIGTVLSGVSGKILKVHQYSISMEGTAYYNLCDAKPGGGTVDFGGYLNGGVVASPNPAFLVKPYVPYPDYLCATTSAGSALCLGTWGTTAMAGTMRIQGLYTATDPS